MRSIFFAKAHMVILAICLSLQVSTVSAFTVFSCEAYASTSPKKQTIKKLRGKQKQNKKGKQVTSR